MDGAWKTRETLLIRLKNRNDDLAWNEFEGYYREFILMVLRKMNIYPSELDDLVQDILIKVWKVFLDGYYDRDRARFRVLLSRIIRNQAIDYIRVTTRRGRKHTEAIENEGLLGMSEFNDSEMESIIQKEWEVYLYKRALENILPLFSELAMKTFYLSLDGVSTSEIAAQQGVKPNSVIKLRNRVRERLAKEVKVLRQDLEPM